MLAPGTRVEHYEILGAIGHGGMGEVYRARDTKLDREVAFKIVRDQFSADPDRLSRFQREAKLLALLNHPHIAQIYGVASANGVDAIVMELVEGETLQARLKRGALPIDEAIQVGTQTAEALEIAHERGIVHRDLKPGNIMLTPDGSVKVLDFGLAKALAPAAAEMDLSHSPTVLTGLHTDANVLLGTAAYMSPEQVRGRVADERSDIWGFGCVLYEMLTGQQPFTGETASDIMGGILRVEPDWNAQPAAIPKPIEAVIKRCLQKDRRQRYHAIGDVRHDLVAAHTAKPEGAPSRITRRESIAWGLVAVLAAAVAGTFVVRSFLASPPPRPQTTRFPIEFPPDTFLGPGTGEPMPAVSPDGRFTLYRAASGGTARLWVRPIGSQTSQMLSGTETPAVQGGYPFWSANSRYIAFFVGGKLKKIAVEGGPPQILCDATGSGGAWNQEDVILFEHNGALHRVSAGGGVSTVIGEPDKAKGETGYRWPAFLPDGRHFLYLATNADPGRSELRVAALDAPGYQSLFAANSRALFAAPGHILFVRDGSLMAQPFDPHRRALAGAAFPLAEGLPFSAALGNAPFGVSATGTLVYRLGASFSTTELTWFDRSGKNSGALKTAGFLLNPAMAPDQGRIAVERREAAGLDLWVVDLVRGTNSRFTFEAGDDRYPVFSPDGSQIAFTSNRDAGFGVYVKTASGVGAEQLLLKVSGANVGVADWSPDAKVLLYNVLTSDNGYDTWAIPMTGDNKPFPVLNQKYNEFRTRFSPDGKWMLYTSNETGRDEIYVQAFPPAGGKWQVSVDGANFAYWRRDGKEIVFDSADRRMMAVDVTLGATFEAGVPRVLFPFPGSLPASRWVMLRDASRFLITLTPQAQERPSLRAVLNWNAELKN